jgi:tripartite ATP-independent transporter DctP family solute receptor
MATAISTMRLLSTKSAAETISGALPTNATYQLWEEKMDVLQTTRRGLIKGLALVALSATMITGLTTAAAAQTTLRIAVPDPVGSSVGRAATRFAELVDEKTGGEVRFEVFPDGVLFGGDQNAAVNQLGSGSLDGLILASSVYASFEPRMNAISLPYLFADYDQLQAYLQGEPGTELLASLERFSIKGLGFFLRTFRDVTTRDTAITTAEDFADLTLRVPNNPLFVGLFEALGANPTPMAFSEVYSALQLGAIDGQENPVEVPFNNQFFEVQGHLNITQHVADSFLVALSSSAWDRIPEDWRDEVEAAADEMIAEHDAEEIAAEADIIAQLEERGMQVNRFAEGELERVQAIARGIYPQFEEQIGAEFVQKSLDFVAQ